MRALILLSLCLLSACGFEPLYQTGPKGGISAALTGVEVSPIPDRIGQIVHNHLTRSVRPQDNGTSTHRLEISLEPSVEGFGFRSDEAITRERIRLVARYQLIDLTSGDVVFDDVVRSDTSIDVVQSDYATLVAEERAGERNAEQISNLILSRLALYFRAQEKRSEGAQ